jgi:hypothetical protein
VRLNAECIQTPACGNYRGIEWRSLSRMGRIPFIVFEYASK